MSGPERRDEQHRHENDPTGNGMVNDGPEKTPHADPERSHDDSAKPGQGDHAHPDAENLTAAESSADEAGAEGGGGGGASEAGAEGVPGAGSGASAEGAEEARGAEGGGVGGASEADAEGVPGAASGAVPCPTDLFAGVRGATDSDGPARGELGDEGPVADRPAEGPVAGGPAELDEVALRRMLHGAVRQLEPSDGTLDHLHRAVPARRAKRRQAVVGAAAAALLIGTAVPAFVHVATSEGPSDARPAIAGHGEQAQGGNGDEPSPEEHDAASVAPSERESEGGKGEPDPSRSPSAGPGSDPDATATGGGEASDTARAGIASVPVCDPGQLGVASAGADAPGSDGTVYGSFKIANVSGEDCTVSSNGTVGFTAIGAADPLKINVVQHSAGGAAPGLPDPAQEPGSVLLKPSMAYEVKFAWVPADTCPTVGPSPSPTPTSDGAGGTGGEGNAGHSGPDAQSLREDGGGMAEGSVSVRHTPEAGAPTAETVIANACSGTIYRTGLLATS
ncbi:hypothetical protein [Streptomyces sp. NPDC101181]|uniref:hypothetical protein n=1 Tax=Streptomyces sp. NPDC101181 TaxID=3366125 RepID=UPI0038211815